MNQADRGSFTVLCAAIAVFLAAACHAAAVSLMISVRPNGELRISTTDRDVNLKLSHSIDGYLTKCDRRTILAWGKPLKFNPNNPQESMLTIVDVGSLKIRREAYLSKGIYSAEFLSLRPEVIVWTDTGVVIDLEAGKTLPPPDQMDFDSADYRRETCPDFPYKSFNRYPEE
jgi:hypothetical protein